MDKPIDGGEEMMEIDEIVEEEEYDEDTNQIEALEELEDLDDVLATPSQLPMTPVPTVPTSPPRTLKTYTKYVPSSALAKIAPKPSTLRTIATSSSVAGPNHQIVIINNQQIRLANQSIVQLNKTPTLAAKPVVATVGGTTGIVNIAPKSTMVNSNSLGRFIVKSSSGQRIMLTTPTTAIKVASTGSVATTSTVTVSSLASTNRTQIQRPLIAGNVQRMGLVTTNKLKELVTAAAQKPNGSTTVVTTPSTQSATTTLVMTTLASTRPSPTIIPSNSTKTATVSNSSSSSTTTAVATPSTSTMVKSAPATISTGQAQKILIQTPSGIQRQVMLPAHLYKLAQQGQIKAVSYTGKSIQYVRVNPKGPAGNIPAGTTQAQVTATVTSTVTSVTKTPHPVKLIQTVSRLDSSVAGSSISRPTIKSQSFQPMPIKRVAPSTATTSTRIINPVKQETEGSVSTAASTTTGGYRLLNAVGGNIAGVTTKNAVVANKFKTLGLAQPAKNQIKDEQLDDLELALSFGNPRKYQQIQHDLKYEGGDFYQNAVSATVAIKAPPSPPAPPVVADGLRRKHCNCTKSQCLKLYCDCFANGEFCFNCNCKECFNNLENEDEREKAIKMCLDRNPMAFKPKIGKVKDQTDTLRRHTKGCNCKRSGCLKNYCECYEAKIACSENCKCIDCRNVEDSDGHFDDSHRHNTHTNSSNSSMAGTSASAKANTLDTSGTALKNYEKNVDLDSPTLLAKKPCNFMTQDVIEATIQCVVAQADECQKSNLDSKTSERLILEEFGRCLVEIIEFSLKNTDN